MSEQIKSSRRLYDGRVIHLRIDTAELPNGRQYNREIVEHNGAIAVVPMLDPETVVLVRQYRYAAGKQLLEIPAGSIEALEEPLDCALREIQEEIHYAAGSMKKLFQSYVAPGYSTELIHTFVATGLTHHALPGDAEESIEIVTMPLREAIRLIDSGEIEDSKSIAGLLYLERFPELRKDPSHL